MQQQSSEDTQFGVAQTDQTFQNEKMSLRTFGAAADQENICTDRSIIGNGD